MCAVRTALAVFTPVCQLGALAQGTDIDAVSELFSPDPPVSIDVRTAGMLNGWCWVAGG